MSPDKITELQRKPPLIDWEEIFLGDVLNDMDLDRLNACRELPALAFEDYKHRKTWQALKGCKTYDELLDVGMDYLDKGSSGMKFVTARNHVYLHALSVMGFDKVDKWKETLPTKYGYQGPDLNAIEARRFNHTKKPDKPEPRFLIQGKGVATPGNICNIIAQAKCGKSALIGAWLAAAIVAESGEEADTLGVSSVPTNGRILLHIDTEQSLYDADAHIHRALKRSSAETTPTWLWSYHLAGFSPDQIRAALGVLLPKAEAAGGVFAVIVDGVADLVDDVNNPDACNPFVAEVQGMAIRYDCPIVTVIHENPTQDSGKARGHLGSQLIRKAESNLRLKKTDGVTVVFAEELQRGAPILQKDGPAFHWDEAKQMHVSTRRVDPQAEELRSLANEVFNGNAMLRHGEVVNSICTAGGYAEKTGQKKFTAIKKAGLIRDAGAGKWMLAA